MSFMKKVTIAVKFFRCCKSNNRVCVVLEIHPCTMQFNAVKYDMHLFLFKNSLKCLVSKFPPSVGPHLGLYLPKSTQM